MTAISTDELVQALQVEFVAFVDAFDGLSDGQMRTVWYGEWSACDIVAHLAGWLEQGAAMLERISNGQPPAPPGAGSSDDDAVNARYVQQRRGLSPADILEELNDRHQAFVAAARAVPGERFPEGGPAYHIVSDTINDFRHHAPPIQEWRQREGI